MLNARRILISLSKLSIYNALQHTATHCNTLQHTATHKLHASRILTVTGEKKRKTDRQKPTHTSERREVGINNILSGSTFFQEQTADFRLVHAPIIQKTATYDEC